MDKNLIKEIIIDQRSLFEKKEFIPRIFPDNFITAKKISVIAGIRRSGKSTLLRQISAAMQSFSYMNFEDERMLDFNYRDFNAMYEVFLELYGDQKAYLFDKI